MESSAWLLGGIVFTNRRPFRVSTTSDQTKLNLINLLDVSFSNTATVCNAFAHKNCRRHTVLAQSSAARGKTRTKAGQRTDALCFAARRRLYLGLMRRRAATAAAPLKGSARHTNEKPRTASVYSQRVRTTLRTRAAEK